VLGLPVSVLPALRASILGPGAKGLDFEGVDSRSLEGFLLDGGRLFGAYELTDRLLGVIIGTWFPVPGTSGRFVGDWGRGVGKPDGRGGCWP